MHTSVVTSVMCPNKSELLTPHSFPPEDPFLDVRQHIRETQGSRGRTRGLSPAFLGCGHASRALHTRSQRSGQPAGLCPRHEQEVGSHFPGSEVEMRDRRRRGRRGGEKRGQRKRGPMGAGRSKTTGRRGGGRRELSPHRTRNSLGGKLALPFRCVS